MRHGPRSRRRAHEDLSLRLRGAGVLREPQLPELRARARVSAGRPVVARPGARRRRQLPRRGRRPAVPQVRQLRRAWRLQLDGGGRRPAGALPRLPAQQRHPQPRRGGEPRALGQGGDRQAPPRLLAAAPRPAAAAQVRGSRTRAGLRHQDRRADPARAHRPRRRSHHPQRERGRSGRAREGAGGDERALSHAARSLPPRDRPLLLGPPGARRPRAGAVPRPVRRRARRLRRPPCANYYGGAARRLAPTATSATTPPPTRGRTGPRPSPTTCTSSTRSRPPSTSASPPACPPTPRPARSTTSTS